MESPKPPGRRLEQVRARCVCGERPYAEFRGECVDAVLSRADELAAEVTGALALGSTLVAAEEALAAEDYGSGELGPWDTGQRRISEPSTIRQVRDADGLYMFGDSISVQDGYTLAVRLKARTGDLLAVHNWSGRPTAPAVDALQDWATTYGMPKRILMATGSNDIFAPPVMAGQIDRVMGIAGPARIVYWVNVQVARTSTSVSDAVRLADQRNSAWVNLQLADAQARHANLRIIRWAEFLAAKPSRLTMYLRDGVHTTYPGAGQDARNELICDAIAAP